jgi:membrane-associated phospholipid phosphatase
MYLLFGSINLHVIVNGLFLCVSVVILSVLIINIWWKVSIHTASMGGITGIFIAIAIRYELELLFLIGMMLFISGLVGFARLKLDAHKPSQVYVGFLVGMTMSMLLYFLL